MKLELLNEITKFADLVDKQAEGIKMLTAALLGEAPDMYWKNKQGLYMGLNNATVETIKNFVNPSVIGTSDYGIYDTKIAAQYRENDLLVMESKKILLLEEIYVSSCDASTNTQGLSIKIPIYDNKKVVGVLGQSKPINKLLLMQNMQKIFSFPATETFINRIKFFMVFALLSSGSTQETPTYQPLSRREKEVAYYLLKGYPAIEIAKSLDISIRTVETHLNHMKSKLNCSNKLQLVTKLFALCAAVFDREEIS